MRLICSRKSGIRSRNKGQGIAHKAILNSFACNLKDSLHLEIVSHPSRGRGKQALAGAVTECGKIAMCNGTNLVQTC